MARLLRTCPGTPVRPRVRTVARKKRARASRPGMVLFVVVAALFVAVSLPVVIRGAPLADDFTNCVQPQRAGLGSTLGDSLERLGAARKAHLLEIVITTEVCQHLPFGFAIGVSLALTLAVALLLRGLLRDLGTPDPWPEVGGALWLLHPVGAEAALWPAAMHVPLGLALALAALRLHRSGRHAWGALAVAGACLSVEQVVLALPLAVWIMTPRDRRNQAFAWTVSVVIVLLVAFVALPGDDPRLHLALSERVAGAVRDPGFLVLFPAVGLGLQSIPLAVAWAFPVSVVLLAAGALLGLRFGAVMFADEPDRTDRAGRDAYARRRPRSGRGRQRAHRPQHPASGVSTTLRTHLARDLRCGCSDRVAAAGPKAPTVERCGRRLRLRGPPVAGLQRVDAHRERELHRVGLEPDRRRDSRTAPSSVSAGSSGPWFSRLPGEPSRSTNSSTSGRLGMPSPTTREDGLSSGWRGSCGTIGSALPRERWTAWFRSQIS